MVGTMPAKRQAAVARRQGQHRLDLRGEHGTVQPRLVRGEQRQLAGSALVARQRAAVDSGAAVEWRHGMCFTVRSYRRLLLLADAFVALVAASLERLAVPGLLGRTLGRVGGCGDVCGARAGPTRRDGICG